MRLGVYLHILADTCGSVGVIVSSLVVKYGGPTVIDPIISICIVVLILISIVPLLKSSGLAFLEASRSEMYELVRKEVSVGKVSCCV